MRLQFKHQEFQADAAKAVVDVFAGQPFLTPSHGTDGGVFQRSLAPGNRDCAGRYNAPVVPELSDDVILEHLQEVQRANRIEPSPRLEGKYHLTIEMETGVGKTYTYIKTMYELNRHYGWSKFIIVVPSIAVREGVYKSFQMTQEHFAEEYGRKIRFFIYHSARLAEIDRFASDSSLNVMIINAQAFHARGRDARRIYMRLDELCGRRPIDIIAGTNPILIIDEPQSVEGKQTKENLKDFRPMITLRYSATHRPDSVYNMVYRLNAVEAYNKRLVKKIAVKGITESGTTATDSYVYLESIHLSKDAPAATIRFDVKGKNGVKPQSRTVDVGYNLFRQSGGLSEYRDGFVVKSIDGRDSSLEFINGIKMYAGDVIGRVSEEQLRRIQIRETILSHIQRERQLFDKGIKVLSLFFIDEVDHYRHYDDSGKPCNGIFADIFEEEYEDVVGSLQRGPDKDDYREYLESISAEKTHAGYFSIDKRGRMINSKLSDRKGRMSDDRDAYDLIMKNKELLLDRDPVRSPVRFIFSHSALREGWDNPNVFQICTLKSFGSQVRKRQEVGRGLRLCVNRDGERMDANALGKDVHKVNVLTVIASESYDSFARGLQAELAEAVADCPGAPAEDISVLMPENARSDNVELTCSLEKLHSEEFQSLWSRINTKSFYTVDFDTGRLVGKAITALNGRLHVPGICFKVETGQMDRIRSREELLSGKSFARTESGTYGKSVEIGVNHGVKYDLVGRLAEETGLTRKAVIQILTGIEKRIFDQFRQNPEEFIFQAAALINDEKAAAVMEHITYHAVEARYDTGIFTRAVIKGRLGMNVMKADKHLYDHVVYDSPGERAFAEKLDASNEVAVYVKLPDRFYIATPVGRYTPDWAIAFYKGSVKHVYFVAETGGFVDSALPRPVEAAKIHCAREHFRAVNNCLAAGGEKVVYDVADSYTTLMEKAMGPS